MRATVGFGLLIIAAIAIFMWIRSLGAELTAPAPAASHSQLVQASGGPQIDTFLHVLLALAVVIAAARAVGFAFLLLGQPPVIGEVIAGVLLGPSLLGHMWPAVSAYMLPASVVPFLSVIAQVGIVLYMFLVGLELNPAHLRRNPNAVFTITYSSIIVPFLLGAALSPTLYALLVLMAIVTTVATTPILDRLNRGRALLDDAQAASLRAN